MMNGPCRLEAQVAAQSAAQQQASSGGDDSGALLAQLNTISVFGYVFHWVGYV